MANHLDNLSIASATHLHRQGHITLGQRNAIHEAVRRKAPMGKTKAAPKASAFGSIAPSQSYGSTPMPAASDADQAREDQWS